MLHSESGLTDIGLDNAILVMVDVRKELRSGSTAQVAKPKFYVNEETYTISSNESIGETWHKNRAKGNHI